MFSYIVPFSIMTRSVLLQRNVFFFMRRSQSINETVNQSVDNIIDASGDIQELSSDKLFKCELCDFRAARKDLIMNHKGANHNWCSKCYSSFNRRIKEPH